MSLFFQEFNDVLLHSFLPSNLFDNNVVINAHFLVNQVADRWLFQKLGEEAAQSDLFIEAFKELVDYIERMFIVIKLLALYDTEYQFSNWRFFMTELEFQNVQETSRSSLYLNNVDLLQAEQNHSSELNEDDLEEINGGILPFVAWGLAVGGVAVGTFAVGVVKGWMDSETERIQECRR